MNIMEYFAYIIESLCLFVRRPRKVVGALKGQIEEAERQGVAENTKSNRHSLVIANKLKGQMNLLNHSNYDEI